MYRMMILLIILTSLISNLCYANDVIYLEKDKPAPYDGFLFTPDKTKDTRIKLLERSTFEGLNDSLSKTNTLLEANVKSKDQQLTLVMDRNNQLAETIRSQQSMNNWEKAAYFVAGVLITYFAVKEAHEIYK